MKVIIIAALLVILLVGCIQQPESQQNEAKEVNEGMQNDADGNMQELPTIETVSKALASGKGVVCTYTDTYQGETTTAKIYMKGENIRADVTSDSGTTSMIRKVENGMEYVYISNTESNGDCDWLKFSSQVEEPFVSTTPEVSKEAELGREVASAYNGHEILYKCNEEEVSDSLFDASGKVCDFEELLNTNP